MNGTDQPVTPQARINALNLRHSALEAAISSEHRRPVPDMAILQKLKRKKLYIKQEIHRRSLLAGTIANTTQPPADRGART